jgi:DNA-directed RNA polymerase specialized sigma24 family protein
MKELAALFGVHRNTVATSLRANRVPLRRQGLSEGDVERAAVLYADGWSLANVGKEFHCTAETIRQAFKRAGIDRKRPWARP